MPFAWTPAALDDLHRLFVRQKLTGAQTARLLGRGATRSAVLGKVQRMGWIREDEPGPGRRPSPETRKVNPRLVNPPPRWVKGGPFSKVLPLPKLREITVISTPKPWTERGERECAFPVGEPTEPGGQYSCCAPVERRRSYCAAHWKLMSLEEPALTPDEAETVARIARRAA
ncbi:MAG: GcrA family cell cycle regulator [Caulobacteraceae bacterium]